MKTKKTCIAVIMAIIMIATLAPVSVNAASPSKTVSLSNYTTTVTFKTDNYILHSHKITINNKKHTCSPDLGTVAKGSYYETCYAKLYIKENGSWKSLGILGGYMNSKCTSVSRSLSRGKSYKVIIYRFGVYNNGAGNDKCSSTPTVGITLKNGSF